MRMKRRVLILKLRLPCFFAQAERVDEELEAWVSEGSDIEGSSLQDDHSQDKHMLGSHEGTALEYRDPKKLAK